MKKGVCLLLLFLLVFEVNTFAQSVGGITSGTNEYCTSNNVGFISVTNYTGTIQFWQTSINSGATWDIINNSTTTQSYNNLSQTTWFRVIVKDGSFPSDTSSISVITIHPLAIAGTLSGGGTFCSNSGIGSLIITGNQGNVQFWESSTDNGQNWVTIANTNLVFAYNSINQNTLYRAVVGNVLTCPTDTTNNVSFEIHQQTNGGTLNFSDTICNGSNGDTLKLINNIGTVLNWESSTDNGSTWNTISSIDSSLSYLDLTASTWYKTIVKNGVCPSQNSSIAKLTVVNPQPANAGSDQTIIQYKSCEINGSGNGFASWLPTNGLNNPAIFTPQASPYATTTYTLTLTDLHGCTTRDSVTINVVVPIPEAITPNDDGVNDYFIIDKINDYSGNSLSITNRWGIEVYSASPYKNDWNGVNKNGKDLPDDIYYYVFDYGNESKGIVSGFILIKR